MMLRGIPLVDVSHICAYVPDTYVVHDLSLGGSELLTKNSPPLVSESENLSFAAVISNY